MTDEPHLAVLANKVDSEAVMAALREEGVYDATRKVREHDEETLELPVTDPPAETAVRNVVEQVDPDRRLTDLDAHLRERGWSDEEIARAPGSWAVVGSVVLVTFDDRGRDPDDREGSRDRREDPSRREAVGEALLDLHGEADTVLAREGISGEHREPAVSVVAGEGDTETVHVEHGTRYALDLAEVMFSPGNKAERARMGDVVDAGERVLDMFAGIGYFTLPMARAGAAVTAVERNPTAYRYLLENAVLNGVQDAVDPIRADCREVRVDDPVDRVVMGYYDATEPRPDERAAGGEGSYEYLDAALAALAPGGVVHVHEATPEPLVWDRPVSRLHDAATERGRGATVLDRRTVKSHSEGVRHVVVDARIE